MPKRWNFKEEKTKLKKLKKKLPRAIAVIAKNHYVKSFKEGGFTDKSFKKWAVRKGNTDPGRATLIGDGKKQQAGTLRDSIEIRRDTFKDIRVGTNNPYAKYHNKGQGHKKRQFIGESRVVTNKVIKLINAQLRKIF
jgi:phage gpG-like protein